MAVVKHGEIQPTHAGAFRRRWRPLAIAHKPSRHCNTTVSPKLHCVALQRAIVQSASGLKRLARILHEPSRRLSLLPTNQRTLTISTPQPAAELTTRDHHLAVDDGDAVLQILDAITHLWHQPHPPHSPAQIRTAVRKTYRLAKGCKSGQPRPSQPLPSAALSRRTVS